MFESKVYVNRRRALIEGMAMRLSGDKGIAVLSRNITVQDGATVEGGAIIDKDVLKGGT